MMPKYGHLTGAPNENILQNHLNIAVVKRILVFKQTEAYFHPLKIVHLFGFPS